MADEKCQGRLNLLATFWRALVGTDRDSMLGVLLSAKTTISLSCCGD